MSLGVYNAAAFINASGIANIAAGAAITVRNESDGNLADIYSDRDGLYPIAQPGFVADSDGYFEFYALGVADGYSVRAVSGTLDITVHFQPLGTARYLDAGAVGAAVLVSETNEEAQDSMAALGRTRQDQDFTGGVKLTTVDLGIMESGQLTPDPGDGPAQKYVNDGDHDLAPHSTAYGHYVLDIENGSGAGVITTEGTGLWDYTSGDAFTTNPGDKFKCFAYISEVSSLLIVVAMQ